MKMRHFRTVEVWVEQRERKKCDSLKVRIEDDVQITENGCINYSADLPRTVDEIETYMAAHNPHVKKQ